MAMILNDMDEIVAKQQNGEWKFLDDEFQSKFETLLIEGIAYRHKHYVPGDTKFEGLFWEEIKAMGYDLVTVAKELATVDATVQASKTEVTIMPKALVDKLPAKAKEIYEAAYESALKDGDEESAAKVAIAAVKDAGYSKNDEGEWVKAEEPGEEEEEKMQFAKMHFAKASLDPESGEMRWSATVSKFDEDDQGDEVTPDFFKSAIAVIESGKRPSPVMCVSHIDKGKPDDSWVAGDVTALFIDGDLPKAKGTFRSTPLGIAAFEAVQTDIKSRMPREKRARISMGFYDEASVAKSKGEGRKFLRGWVKHLAMTRVPVVKETAFDDQVQKGVTGMTTIREDATSIVGEELAKTLLADIKRDKALVVKQEGEREDQIKALLQKLITLLEGPEGENLEMDGERLALGNRGTNPARAEEHKAEVETFVSAFAELVKSTLVGAGDRQQKFTAIQQGLDQFGEGVMRLVKGNTPPSGSDISEAVRSAVEQAVRPLQEEVMQLRAQVGSASTTPASVPGEPTSMDTRVQMTHPPVLPGGGAGPQTLQRKAKTAQELAWASTAPTRY